MPGDARQKPRKIKSYLSKIGFPLLIFVSIIALTLTFIISISANSYSFKLSAFIVTTVIYLILALIIGKFRPASFDPATPPIDIETYAPPGETFSSVIEEKLLALEEANSIFSSSLKPADMFRLVSNRINEIIPFSLSALYLADINRKSLRISYAFGRDAAVLSDVEIEMNSGVAGLAFQSGEIQADQTLSAEKQNFPLEILSDLKSAIACPLAYEAENYGALVLYSAEKREYGADAKKLLQAIGARISPLFISSITFENNLNNALNDSLTNLPNERALFMLLENQVAESQRFREQRPLTVVSIDVKNFAQLNNTYGHATGDRILSFAAKNIKEQLRQMDFLSRLAGDEFLAVLPTSSDKTTEMIIERIKKTFAENPFMITPQDKVFIELNFGAASFIRDGETAQDLMKIAAIKKREAKSAIKSSVLWFPKEYSN